MKKTTIGDGQVDEGVGEILEVDADQDGYGNINQPQQSCELVARLSAVAGGLHDRNESIHPDALSFAMSSITIVMAMLTKTVSQRSTWSADLDGSGIQTLRSQLLTTSWLCAQRRRL